jgi:hypothetical protein
MGRYTAVLVEPRQHRAIEFCIRNLIENLDSDWDVLVLHGNLSAEYVRDVVSKFPEHAARISMTNLGVDNLVSAEYSQLLASKAFYHLIPTEVFLITQTDAMINPNNKDAIHAFLDYDYVGAPWNKPELTELFGKVGNGGFSLRRKSATLKVISTEPYRFGCHEDFYFSSSPILKKPSFEAASYFSSETLWNPKSFGIHKIWHHLSVDADLVPGLAELKSLQ